MYASAVIYLRTELPDSKLGWSLSQKWFEIWDHSSVKLKTSNTPSLQRKGTYFQTTVIEQNPLRKACFYMTKEIQ